MSINMRTSLNGKAFISHTEGVILSKYKCSAGVWTIGIGATRSEIKDLAKWPMDKNITIYEAFDLLDKALPKYEKPINKRLNKEIPQEAFDALVSWAYNVGGGWARKASVLGTINNWRDWLRLVRYVNKVSKGDDESRLITKTYPTSFIRSLQIKGFKYKSCEIRGNKITASKAWHNLMLYKKPREIVGRRSKEAHLLVTGEYYPGKTAVYPVNSRGMPIYSKGVVIDAYEFLTPKEVQREKKEIVAAEKAELEKINTQKPETNITLMSRLKKFFKLDRSERL